MKHLLVLIVIFWLPHTLEAGQRSLTNIALHAQVTASSEQQPASAVVDGNHYSYWQSGSFVGDHWLEIDLGQVYHIDRVLLPLVRGTQTLTVEIETSGHGWKQVYSGPTDNPLIGFEPEHTQRIRLSATQSGPLRIYEIRVYQYDPQPVFLNQSGFDLNGFKQFTAPLALDHSRFAVKREADDTVLYEGTIENQVGDFSEFRPLADTGPFVVHVHGEPENGTSVPFYIGPNWIERVAYKPAIDFMIDVRCWFGDARQLGSPGPEPGCRSNLGVAWRDSHQMSFEIPSLVHLYFANPSAFSVDRMPVQGSYTGLREKLPARTPEVVHLIYWAVDIYLREQVNHTLLKGQLAYFLFAWPWLSEYIPRHVYEEVLEYLVPLWDNDEIDRWGWYEQEHSGNLLQTYTMLGTGKGELPIGHSIVPNLLMYEVARREQMPDARRFFDAAYRQTEWLIANLDWSDPLTTKGQRQGEWVTITSLSHFLEHYPDRTPDGLAEKIEQWVDVVFARTRNMWDFRTYAEDRWIIPTIPGFNSPTGFNEVGNIAGFPAPLRAAERVIQSEERRERLARIATAHVDHVFGRNPTGRHFAFHGAYDYEGVNEGWFQEHQGGVGVLQVARGVLDGSPKEPTFPYNPHAGDPGHTEGWVSFNAPWNIALAYLSASKTAVYAYDAQFQAPTDTVQPGDEIGIVLTAPLNFDYARKEHAQAWLHLDGHSYQIELTEANTSSNRFKGRFTIPEGSRGADLRLTYGMGWHEVSAMVIVR